MKVLRLLWELLTEWLMDGVDRALKGVEASDVPGAKEAVCAWVQKHKRVPGTLRALACRAVNAITARDVPEFRQRLRDAVDG